MVLIPMKYLKTYVSKGKEYRYYRRGKFNVRLVEKPGSAAFASEYAKADTDYNKKPENTANTVIVPGTFRELATKYLASPEFKAVRETTKKNYRQGTNLAIQLLGRWSVDKIEMPHIVKLRDKYAATPGKANLLVQQIRLIYGWGIPRGYAKHNPANFRDTSIRALPTGEHMPWPEPLLEKFLLHAAPEVAATIAVGLYTGQRIGDCLKLSWRDISANGIKVTQQKTGKDLLIPLHPDLEIVLDALPKRSTRILTTKTGRVWTMTNWHETLKREKNRLGGDGYVFHGLRKSAVCRLIQAGCSTHEAGSITGQSADMVEYYARQIDQQKLAKSAMQKLILWGKKRTE